ncbi:MAG: mechanosensitive ion channel domain-containing protein [Cyanobacteria bacterium P01_A01_bin.37]
MRWQWFNCTPTQRGVMSVLWAIALALTLWIGLAAKLPAQGIVQLEETIDTAAVVLDGQPLFDVAAYGETSAQERADIISSKLDNVVNQTVSVSRTGKTIILLDATGNAIEDGELLTVEKNDVRTFNRTNTPNVSAEQLAAQWRTDIQNALNQAEEERSVDFLRRALLLSAASLMFAAIAHWWLRRIQRRVLVNPLQEIKHLLKQSESDTARIWTSLLKSLASLALILARIGIWCASIGYVVNLFPQTRESGYRAFRTIRDSLLSPIFPLGDHTYSVTDIFILIGAFFGIFLAATLLTNVLRSRILNIAGISTGSQEAIATLTRYTLIALGTLVILQVWGLDLSSLTLLASALGVGIGFGFQNIAKDFGSGLILLFERPVQVGDFVEVGLFQGTVDRIGARSTSVKTLDRVSIIVPNSYFLENQVINWSHENPLSRISIPVGVSYDADPEDVRALLLQAAEEHAAIVHFPKPQVFFDGFGESSLNFLLLVWIVQPNQQLIIKSDLYFQVFALLKRKDIKIPFPQRDLHVRSGQLPIHLNSAHEFPLPTPSIDSDAVNSDAVNSNPGNREVPGSS